VSLILSTREINYVFRDARWTSAAVFCDWVIEIGKGFVRLQMLVKKSGTRSAQTTHVHDRTGLYLLIKGHDINFASELILASSRLGHASRIAFQTAWRDTRSNTAPESCWSILAEIPSSESTLLLCKVHGVLLNITFRHGSGFNVLDVLFYHV
jgi:hypothetical protein